MNKKSVLSLGIALSLLTGCGGGVAEIPTTSTPPSIQPTARAIQAEYTSGNALSLRLLQSELSQHAGKNVIVSPLSIELALGMAANGATGDAQAALSTLFGLNVEEMNTLLHTCLERGDETLSTANGMWFNENLNGLIAPSFKNTLSDVYQAEEGFFQAGSDASTNQINAWVSEKTNGRIPSILEPDDLTNETLALLVNALYFNGKWQKPFEEGQVSDGVFHGVSGDEDAEFMSETLDAYFETSEATGFSKRYENGYEFIGILPKAEGEVALNGLDLDRFLDSVTYDYDVNIQIPKFELEYTTYLNQTLKELGLGSLFEEHSMDGLLTDEAKAQDWQAQISKVLHKTYMRMYEEGTEAAAVTAVMVAGAMLVEKETKEVFLNRPFAFLIRDTETEQMVFCGAINTLKN